MKGIFQDTVRNQKMSHVVLLQPPPWRLEEAQKSIFCSEALEFLQEMFRAFDDKIEKLYVERQRRRCEVRAGRLPQFRKSRERSDKTWRVAPLPPRVRCRHVDLGDVSAANTAHFVDALNSDVQGVQVDFDDGHCPTWRNQIQSYHNIREAVAGRLPGAPASVAACPVLMLRPRAWNIIDHNVMVDGKEVPGPLVDFAILMFHNARRLSEASSGPYFYISKLEGAGEAALWDELFTWGETALGVASGSVRACVLIENVLSSFELEEILFALRRHSLGLNCGVWDYAASIINKFGWRADFVLPDRNKYVNMERHFMRSYLQLVVRTCHARGAPATGGMAAAVLPPGADVAAPQSKSLISDILAAKLKEMEVGADGFLVYDLRVVPHVNELWKKYGASPNQISKQLSVEVTPEDLLRMPSGGVTLAGVRHNVAVATLFVYHWLAGAGHFFYDGHVEDSATAEISRSQIWQWIRFSPVLEDDTEQRVTVQLVEKVAATFAARAHKNLCRSAAERKRLTAARYMALELFCLRDPPEFITTYLNDNHKFRTLHNKALLSSKSHL